MTEHNHAAVDPEIAELWRTVLTDGHIDKPSWYLPGANRCGLCLIPLSGFGRAVMKTLRGRTPSRKKNPAMCNL
jgi:hypothetical protein